MVNHDEVFGTKMLEVLTNQRNSALDMVTRLQAEMAVLQAEMAEYQNQPLPPETETVAPAPEAA